MYRAAVGARKPDRDRGGGDDERGDKPGRGDQLDEREGAAARAARPRAKARAFETMFETGITTNITHGNRLRIKSRESECVSLAADAGAQPAGLRQIV
jgi:hypothetical protein